MNNHIKNPVIILFGTTKSITDARELTLPHENFRGTIMNSAKISQSKWRQFQTLFLTGVVLSFLGWLWETIFSFFLRSPNDRGFLLLPICPIYGFALIFVYLLFGTPADMRLLGHPILHNQPILRYLSYFIASALLSTAIELVTATFFQSLFGIKLWSYAFLTDGLSDTIALIPSLFWGLAVTVFMQFLFHPLFHAIGKIKPKLLNGFFWGLLFLLIADAAFNFAYLSVSGRHYDIPLFDKIKI